MSGLIDEGVLEQILSRVDIVDVISGCIPLKRAGRNFKANCPFHHEKTASFMVSAEKQIFHCFGCGAGGNAFNFLMLYERLEFPEAAEKLAKKAGVTIPERQKSAGQGQSAQILRALELAAVYFQERLFSPEGAAACGYLDKRGVRKETAKLFRLGYAPDRPAGLIEYLRAKDLTLGLMEKAGLVSPVGSGGYIDRFRGRVIFAISNNKGEVIGFGARTLGQGEPKYLNSPETQVYVKGKNLFNLNLARESLRETDELVLVEGYMDCLIPYQAGLHNICASCGTSLTQEQAKLIKRYTRNVVVLYDADRAGQSAALRTLDIFLEEEMNVRVAALPEGDDPDTFVRRNGAEALKQRVASADNLFDYKLKLLRAAHDEKLAEGIQKITAEMLPTIKKVPDAVLKGEYIKRLAEKLRIPEEFLYSELRKIQEVNPYSYRGMEPNIALSAGIQTEKLLIKLMLEETALIHQVKERLELQDFQDRLTSRTVSLMFDLVTRGRDPKASLLVNLDAEISSLVRETMMNEDELHVPQGDEERNRTLRECIRRLKENSRRFKCRRLQEAIKQAELENDEQRRTELTVEFNNLIKSKQETSGD